MLCSCTQAGRPLAMSLLLSFLIIPYGCMEESANHTPCVEGTSCDDNDTSTENDIYDANCNCFGTDIDCFESGDSDGDGVCSDIDCNDSDASDIRTDADGDGACSDIDCDDSDSSVYVGAPCDDGNEGTENDMINSACLCAGQLAYGSFTDPRNEETYHTVQIGDKIWMAENLNFEFGTSWCFDDDPINCSIYGRMYNWYSALDVCPVDWHLPSYDEWLEAFKLLGGLQKAGGAMKSLSPLWNDPNYGATNSSGFTGHPGGCRAISTGQFNMEGITGFWWSASMSQSSANNAYVPALNVHTTQILETAGKLEDGLSVRCVRNE